MTYKGVYSQLKNPQKYLGSSPPTFRSSWERATFKWLDNNTKVIAWSSEEFAIPYICETDNKPHHYYPDLYIEMDTGAKLLVEIKPAEQIKSPKPRKRTKKFIAEVMTFAKNKSKWIAARKFAVDNNLKFLIWTQHDLKSMGISVVTNSSDRNLMRAERKLLPNSKYNPKNRRKKSKVAKPRRRS